MNATRKKKQLTEAERKRRFEERQAWIDAIQRRRDLSPAARLIGGRVGWHKNLITGQCNPGYGTLGDESGYPVRTAIRAVAELERAGCIRVNRTRGGSKNDSNSYTLIPQSDTATSDTTSRVDEHVTRDKRRARPVSPRHPNLENLDRGTAKAVPLVERERDACASTPTAPATADAAGAEVQARKQEIIEPPRVLLPNQDGFAGWRELRGLWTRPWCDDQQADRRAFAVACQEAAPEDIIAGARTWVEAADAPRFLPKLCNWLGDRAWEKPPPKRARANGHRRNGNKVDQAALCLAHGNRSMKINTPMWGDGQ